MTFGHRDSAFVTYKTFDDVIVQKLVYDRVEKSAIKANFPYLKSNCLRHLPWKPVHINFCRNLDKHLFDTVKGARYQKAVILR